MKTVEESSNRLKLSSNKKVKVLAKSSNNKGPFVGGGGLVLFVSLAFSLGKQYFSLSLIKWSENMCLYVWQPKCSIYQGSLQPGWSGEPPDTMVCLLHPIF